MASTYSSLKIQLMATGENTGTWGNVTNDNLGIAIEEAIVGSADVTFASADVTLTLANTNATQTARNLRLNLTGTVAAPQNLIVPAIEKVYIVNNGLSQTITVKNSTGTGIAVPAGKTMYVYNDGTNVVDAITHLTSLTLASPLPVASGGTGSNTATFSGVNITDLNASNISSGTLSNARTTAASANGASTIVARGASGEFSAGTITATFSGSGAALSSLNASNVTSGTLAIAQGGTGSATASFSGANITSLNASNVSSGVLAVAQGGTGSATATFSGANITSLNASNISSGTLANARTTATDSNGASTIVARDASGNFSANVITANGSAITAINASNISTGTLAVARGGTGAATLTGLVVGNGTSAFTTVTAPSGTVVGTTDTQTLTNKRVNPRVVAASATSGNLTINGDTTDVYKAEGLTGAITFLTPSGTPVDGQKLVIRIEDNGTSRAITWTATSGAFRAIGITLPTATVSGKTTYVGCMYNSTDTFWDAIATVTQV